MKDFNEHPGDTLWREGGVRWVVLPSGGSTAVELRSEHGGVFLRKLAPNMTAARNEARLRAHPETGQVPILVVTASPQDDPDSDCPDAVLARLLLSRVLPTAASLPPVAPTA